MVEIVLRFISPPRRSLTMSCHPRVTEWTTTLQLYLPHLSKPQIRVLALWSLGMVLARSWALTAVSVCLAPWLQCKDNTLRQRLREFCYEAPAKRRKARQAVRVETCFAPLLLTGTPYNKTTFYETGDRCEV